MCELVLAYCINFDWILHLLKNNYMQANAHVRVSRKLDCESVHYQHIPLHGIGNFGTFKAVWANQATIP